MSEYQPSRADAVAGSGPSTWLTVRRLRTHAAIVAVCLWSLYLWNLSTPGLRDRGGNLKGTDFLHFYVLGSIAATHRGSDLYNMNAQAALATQRVPQATGLKYLPLYPPQVSILFAPLAQLSYAWALALWWILSAAIYAISVYAVWRACPKLDHYGTTVLLAAIGFPAFLHLIAWGQTSALALGCFTGAFFLWRERREFFAGLVLGCLVFKPQLTVAAAIVLLLIGGWRVIGGAMISASAQLMAGMLYWGTAPFRQWIGVMRNVRTLLPLLEPKPYQTHSLRTFWSMLIPPGLISSGDIAFALYGISAAAVLWWTISLWRQRPEAPLTLRYSSLLLASVLIAPHLTVYDLVILAPALLMVSDWLISEWARKSARILGLLLYCVYMLPLLGPLTRWTHVQLSVIAMAGCVYAMWRIWGQASVANDSSLSSAKAYVQRFLTTLARKHENGRASS